MSHRCAKKNNKKYSQCGIGGVLGDRYVTLGRVKTVTLLLGNFTAVVASTQISVIKILVVVPE